MPLGVEALEAAVDAALAAEASRDCSPRESACQCDAEAAEASCMQRTARQASTVFHLQNAQELQGLCLHRFLRRFSLVDDWLVGYVG